MNFSRTRTYRSHWELLRDPHRGRRNNVVFLFAYEGQCAKDKYSCLFLGNIVHLCATVDDFPKCVKPTLTPTVDISRFFANNKLYFKLRVLCFVLFLSVLSINLGFVILSHPVRSHVAPLQNGHLHFAHFNCFCISHCFNF